MLATDSVPRDAKTSHGEVSRICRFCHSVGRGKHVPCLDACATSERQDHPFALSEERRTVGGMLLNWPPNGRAADILLESVVKRRCRLARVSLPAVEKNEVSGRDEAGPAVGKVSCSGDRKEGNRSSSMRPLRELGYAMIAVQQAVSKKHPQYNHCCGRVQCLTS